jgi:hypothetical protein
MLVSGLAGSVADLVYGYTVACQEQAKAYQQSGGSEGH